MTSPTTKIQVRAATDNDFDGWAQLFRSYREGEHLKADEAVVRRVWQWISEPDTGFDAFVAVINQEEIAGLIHYRRFHRPLSGTLGLYIDNIATAPEWRRQGVAQRLLAEVVSKADSLGYPLVRWMAAEANLAARTLYDRIVPPATWVVYDLNPGMVTTRGRLIESPSSTD